MKWWVVTQLLARYLNDQTTEAEAWEGGGMILCGGDAVGNGSCFDVVNDIARLFTSLVHNFSALMRSTLGLQKTHARRFIKQPKANRDYHHSLIILPSESFFSIGHSRTRKDFPSLKTKLRWWIDKNLVLSPSGECLGCCCCWGEKSRKLDHWIGRLSVQKWSQPKIRRSLSWNI